VTQNEIGRELQNLLTEKYDYLCKHTDDADYIQRRLRADGEHFCKVNKIDVPEGLTDYICHILENSLPSSALVETSRPDPTAETCVAPDPVKTILEPQIDETPHVSWVDRQLAEFEEEINAQPVVEGPTPQPKTTKKHTVKYDPRNNAKAIGKELIINFLNADRNRRRKGFKISTIYKTVDWVHQVTERTMRTYLEELYKGNRVKRYEEKVTLDSGQVVYHHWFTSTANSDPKYHLWLEK